MKPVYSIQKPCIEDWGKMTAEQQGRHCQVCCKTVVDFSKKDNEEIIGFLKNNSGQKVCGRFRADQLNPAVQRSLPQRRAPRYRVFFAALVFVFGGMLFTSCKSHTHQPELMGDVAYVPGSTQQVNNDSALNKIPVPDSTKRTGEMKKVKCEKTEVKVEQPEYLLGDIAFDPADTIH